MPQDSAKLPEIIKTPRTDPVYNCHSYLTKVPVAAIIPFVEEFTAPNELIVDPFAGSGMTGIAAGVRGRRALLSDISVLGQHIAKGFLAPVIPEDLRASAERAVAEAKSAVGKIYLTRRVSDGKTVELKRTVWSFTYICKNCSHEISYFNHIQISGKSPEQCPECKAPFQRRSWPKSEDTPVQVVVKGPDGKLADQEIQPIDLKRIRDAQVDSRQEKVPSLIIDSSREMYRRSALHKHNLTETKHFFSPRNAIALLELWNAINTTKSKALRQKLRFAFTAILPRASRRYQWGPKRPLNAQNQTYYIAPIYYEWNVFDLFLRKVEAAIRADNYIHRSLPLFTSDSCNSVEYLLKSADSLAHIQDESVDYVFTDPPFGSNIFYSDMNLFHEAWLGQTTDDSQEAVIHKSNNKKHGSAARYEHILSGAFRELYRILKPGRHLSVVFGNSRGDIWALVQRALREAGFDSPPVHVAILDKGQRSVKGLNSGSEQVVTVDLVMTVQKDPAGPRNSIDADSSQQANPKDLINTVLDNLNTDHTCSPSYVYAATVREAIRQHLFVDNLHLSDVLIALRNAGFQIDPKTGLLISKD